MQEIVGRLPRECPGLLRGSHAVEQAQFAREVVIDPGWVHRPRGGRGVPTIARRYGEFGAFTVRVLRRVFMAQARRLYRAVTPVRRTCRRVALADLAQQLVGLVPRPTVAGN